jgi:LysR family positive regulator for ilvC
MDDETLRIFLSLARSLHFGRASKHVHKSASAVSRAIQRLEEQLGHPLFERDNRRVKLTAQGEAFQRFASETLSRAAARA